MSIKSGELIHVGNSVLVDRAQTAGPGSLNVPQEHIYELGNYRGVGIVRDIPDLKFSLESLDCSAAVEALLAGKDFNSMADGEYIDMATVLPLDVASQFKKGRTADTPYEVEASVAIPFVMAESVNYRYGLSQNASQTVSLQGDALYYSRGSAYIQEIAGSGAAAQSVALDHPVIPYEGDTTNGTRYALAITIAGSGRRLTPFVDYTEQATGAGPTYSVSITLSNNITVDADDKIRVIYQSDQHAAYPQASHAPVSAVKPAALRGRDIEVRVAGTAITNRWSSVQSVDLTWSVRLDRDLEFGNPNVIGQDFQVPEVRGTIEIKPRDYSELLARVQQVAGVTDDSVTGPLSSVQVPLEVILHSPIDGHVLKTLYVPEARFTIPGFSGRVQTKLTVQFPFESDTGDFYVYKGLRP
jgi:hypothetical protein